MELYKALNLPNNLVKDIQDSALAELHGVLLTGEQRHFLKNPQQILDTYFKEHCPELPRLYNCIVFYRDGGIEQPIHFDFNHFDPPQRIHCGINIPLVNCDDSSMQWYDGPHQVITNEVNGVNGRGEPAFRKVLYVRYNHGVEPVVYDEVIINQPILVRIGLPHAISVTDKDRSCISMRFSGNPTFEEISSIFSSAGLI